MSKAPTVVATAVVLVAAAGVFTLGLVIWARTNTCGAQFPPPQCHGTNSGDVLAAGFGSVVMVAGGLVALCAAVALVAAVVARRVS